MTTYAEMMQMCRLCLVKEQVNLPIFDGQGEVQQIFLKITACLPVKVSREDNLPKNICDGCSYKLDLLYQFWNTSSNSEKQLIDWLTAAGVEPKQKSNEPIGLATQPNVILKQEPVTDLDARSSDAIDAISSDTQNYIIQQQQLAYKPEEYDESQQNLSNSTKKKAAADPNDESVSKRPRRSSSYVSTVKDYEDDSDEDYVDNTDAGIAKTEDESEEDDDDEDEDLEDEGDDMADPDFVAKEEEEDSQQPGPSGTKTTSGPSNCDLNDEETVTIETTSGPKRVPKKYVTFAPTVQEKVTITTGRTKDGRSIPLILKSVPVVFKKNLLPTAEKKTIKLQKIDNEDLEYESNSDFEIRQKPTPRTLICSKCGKRFHNQLKLKKHIEKSHVERDLKCPICEEKFKFQNAYYSHLKLHEVDKKYACKYCGRKMASSRVLEVHMRRHTGEYQHKCKDCGKEFYSDFSYSHHRQAEHEGIRYPCEICGSVLKSKRYYRDHMSMHNKKDPRTYECDVCHKYYSTKSALNGHKRIHSGERYICHICGKKSIQKGAHNVHMKMHTGERSFICELCGKDFLRKDVLATHMRRTHEVGHIPCSKCHNIFRTEYQLMVHLHTHSDIDKPFPCQLCDERFIDLNFLRSHVNKVHIENVPVKPKPPPKLKRKTVAGERRFVCYICDATYASTELLREHFKDHNIDDDQDQDEEEITESYTCNCCDEMFDEIKDLNDHLANHHGGNQQFPTIESNEVELFYEDCTKEIIEDM
ncbi:zinc finger protein 846-like isoform X2 [Atheta coriaria]|uniref:zinc finger protein 846-like isoform X2 n=1 Tax=Dalotia coriaria TaxID=877792 RepID=UPI0031F385F1